MARRYDDPERLHRARSFMAAYQRLLPGDEPLDWKRFPDAHPDKPPILAPDWKTPQPQEDDMAKSTAGIGPKGQAKAAKVFHEYGKGQLHSGSKTGPVVSNPKQAVAIALSQARDVSRGKK